MSDSQVQDAARLRAAHRLAGCELRQLYVLNLGHDAPTILLTTDLRSPPGKTHHPRGCSSLEADFDMTLLVVASSLYRLLARDLRGYDQAQARQIFRDLVDMPADVVVKGREVSVEFHRRAPLPIVLASDLFKKPSPSPGGAPRNSHFYDDAGTTWLSQSVFRATGGVRWPSVRLGEYENETVACSRASHSHRVQ